MPSEFKDLKITTENKVIIHLKCGGNGPPLLLLHGYPQTHLIYEWLVR